MGNYLCVSGKSQQVQDEWQGPPAKVIRPDGVIDVYRRAVTVGELMRQHPEHAVCHSSAMISSLTAASMLAADRELEGGRLYYVLPAHKFVEETAKSSPGEGGGKRGVARSRGKLTVEIKSIPGFAQVTVKGQGGVKLQVAGENEVGEEAFVSYSTPDLRSMYLASRSQPILPRSNSWKPRLETINEVGAASRRHIQNFMRARSLRKSQVHSY